MPPSAGGREPGSRTLSRSAPLPLKFLRRRTA